MYVLGIDLGTQGARALITDLDGRVCVEIADAFPPKQVTSEQPGVFEQDPLVWRRSVVTALTEAVSRFVSAGHPATDIAALSVTSTSGTLCMVDAVGEPVGSAIMYSDTRSIAEAEEAQAAGGETVARIGARFNASFALNKALWLQRHAPEVMHRARWLLSPTDLIIGWLSGEWGRTDWTNALKWGYDLVDLRWPEFIARDLALPLEKLPRVEAPGAIVGRADTPLAAQAGLTPSTQVVAGATDGTASQLASGAVSPGEWNSTLGTTLVLKGVSDSLLTDPLGRIYCHRHPDGYWLPGGASSTGADCLARRFDSADLSRLDEAALACAPTDLVIYPLVRRGERFPFLKEDAEGFTLGESDDAATRLAAHLEGLAYVERLAYETVESLGAVVSDTVFAVGGATRSNAGLQIRADVVGRRMWLPRSPSGAMGAAVLAARGVAFTSLHAAARRMVRCQSIIEPRTEHASAYTERYERFIAACRERGYLS